MASGLYPDSQFAVFHQKNFCFFRIQNQGGGGEMSRMATPVNASDRLRRERKRSIKGDSPGYFC
jgi:hypothetical protein